MFMRHVLAANVRDLAKAHFKESRNRPFALHAAAKKAGHTLSLSTVQRILSEETGATLDNIQALADVFDVSVYQLLIPELRVDNPQLVMGAMKDEERMYRRWRQDRAAQKGENETEPRVRRREPST